MIDRAGTLQDVLPRPSTIFNVDNLAGLALPFGVSACHVGRPRLLQAALARADEAAPHLKTLARFLLPRMPRTPLASSTLKTGRAASAPALLKDAVAATWVSINSADWTVAVGADCDHADAEERVDTFMRYLLAADPNAPHPTIVRDPYTARAHVTWILEREVYTGGQTSAGAARSGPVLRTLDAVRHGITAALGADPNFTNRLTKNPWAYGRAELERAWVTQPDGRQVFELLPPAMPSLWDDHITGGTGLRFDVIPGDCWPVSLLTLWRALKLWRDDTGLRIPSPGRHRQRPDATDSEKGCRLFDASRFVAYDLGTSDLRAITAVVEEQAASLGSLASPKAITTIAHSISRFMRTKWTGTKGGKPSKRRGVLGLEAASLELPERQALGGKYGAKMNRKDTDRRIAEAVARLRTAGTRLTQAAVAAEAEVSERTVRDRWHQEIGVSEPAKQCPSGMAAASAAMRAQVLMPRTIGMTQVFGAKVTLLDAAKLDRVTRKTVATLSAVTQAAKKPGAVPSAIPSVPTEVANVSEVCRALCDAENAVKDAQRRATARNARKAAQDRAANFLAWATEDEGRRRWGAFLADLDAEWDAREQEWEGEAGRLATVRRQREAVFSICWRQWRRAQDLVFREREEEIMAVIPW